MSYEDFDPEVDNLPPRAALRNERIIDEFSDDSLEFRLCERVTDEVLEQGQCLLWEPHERHRTSWIHTSRQRRKACGGADPILDPSV